MLRARVVQRLLAALPHLSDLARRRLRVRDVHGHALHAGAYAQARMSVQGDGASGTVLQVRDRCVPAGEVRAMATGLVRGRTAADQVVSQGRMHIRRHLSEWRNQDHTVSLRTFILLFLPGGGA